MEHKVVFVAVAGCTSSGKTTLARALLTLLDDEDDDDNDNCVHVSPPISLDWFLDRSRMPRQEQGVELQRGEEEQMDDEVLNWETPAGVRYDKLQEELVRLRDYLLQNANLAQSASTTSSSYTMHAIHPRHVQLTVTYKENCMTSQKEVVFVVIVEGFLLYYNASVESFHALERRLNRDLPTRLHIPEERAAFESWFDGHIWKCFLEYKNVQLENGKPLYTIDADWAVERQLEYMQSILLEYAILFQQSASRQKYFRQACHQLQAEIATNRVPGLAHPNDAQAMNLVHEAEEAEKRGESNLAISLYRKVMRLSPTVSEFLGL